MELNSIRKNLDKNAIISSIRLMLGADTNRKKTFLLVEGEDDWKFLRKFVGRDVIIYESFSGKKGVHEIISNEHIDSDCVIGIRDRDYFDGNLHDRIFFYDFSCLEMMLLSDDVTHNNVCSECYNGESSPYELRNNVLQSITRISYLRKINEQRSLGLNFKGLSISKMMCDEGGLDIELLFSELQKRHIDRELNEIKTEVKELSLELSFEEYLKLTNGHDYLSCMQCYCNKHCNKGYNVDHISSNYRTAYNVNSFVKTQIYDCLNQYYSNRDREIWKNCSILIA